MELNAKAGRLCDELAERANELRCEVSCCDSGARIIDCGVRAPGGLELGRRLAEVCMADLGRVSFVIYERERFELRSLVSAGVYHLEARGEVETPLVGQSATVWSFAGGAELEASFRLTSALVVAGGVSALLLNPRPAVAVLDDEARFAQPFTTASAGLAVEF